MIYSGAVFRFQRDDDNRFCYGKYCSGSWYLDSTAIGKTICVTMGTLDSGQSVYNQDEHYQIGEFPFIIIHWDCHQGDWRIFIPDSSGSVRGYYLYNTPYMMLSGAGFIEIQ